MATSRKKITPEDLFRAFDAGEIAPVYLLHGVKNYGIEGYIVDLALKALKKLIFGVGSADFDLDTFHADEFNPQRFVESALQLPFTASHRLVLLRGVDKLKADQQDVIMDCIEKPSPSTCIFCTAEQIDARRKFYKAFRPPAMKVECLSPFENKLQPWIRRFAAEEGREISGDAVSHLVECVGRDLHGLHSEVKKAAIYIGDRKRIEAADVEAVTTDVKVHTIWTLIDAVGEKRSDRALYLLRKLLVGGQNPVGVAALIARQLRMIWQAREALDRGKSPREVCDGLRIFGVRQARFLSSTSMFTAEELAHDMALILRADLDLKSSRVDRDVILDRLVLGLCVNAGKNRRGGIRPRPGAC